MVPAEDSGIGGPLTLSQIDIDGLIRSKAAMYTILTTISNTVAISFQEIGRFFVAGTFGSYINPRSAINIGMIPDLPLETYVSLGNTSLAGATLALLDADAQASSVSHSGPNYLPGAECQPGVHEPFQRGQIFAPHGPVPVSIGETAVRLMYSPAICRGAVDF